MSLNIYNSFVMSRCIMIIDISKLLASEGSSVQVEKSLELDSDLFSDSGIILNAPVNVSGDIKSVSGMLYMTMCVNTQFVAQCSRCLSDTTQELSFTINEVFAKPELENENDDVIILDSNEIDLWDIVVQSLSCSLPLTSLCSEDCKGLCPICGCNLNVDVCNCEVEDIDPRLAVLKDFLK